MMQLIFNNFKKIDRFLLFLVLTILTYGLVMLASASLPYADLHYHNPWFFFNRQAIFVFLGFCLGTIMLLIRPFWWYRWRHALLFFTIIALSLMLLPGVGHAVKGSVRWIKIGFFNLQVSEFSKLMMIIYVAGFIDKYNEGLNLDYRIFLRPILIITLVASLVLLEPDFGTVCILLSVTLIQLFVAGARLGYVLILFSIVLCLLSLVAFGAPYRVKRLLSFMEPWEHQDAESYQLIHSLMAVSSGGLFGRGVGESMEKLFYLPEAHTDFLFAIICEELGFFGLLIMLILFLALILRIGFLSYVAFKEKNIFFSSILIGVAAWFGLQALLNIGVNLGCVPTKGITLPFVSYGGSSMLACCLAIGLVLRCTAGLQINKKQ